MFILFLGSMGKTRFFINAVEKMYGVSIYDEESTIKILKERKARMKSKVKLVLERSTLLGGL